VTRTRTQPRPRNRSGAALAATVTAVLAVLALVLLVRGASGAVPPSGGPPPGAAIGADDRRAIDARPVDRGVPAPPADPTVDLRNPDAVARAYLTAAYSAQPEDAGRTHLRAAGYAAPGTPPATVGVLVLDAPPAGSVRTASVRAVDQLAADDADDRRGYRAEIDTATGPPGGPPATARLVRQVVLARQPDGRWLVTAESTTSPDLSAADH
jgi:hypothetical protein